MAQHKNHLLVFLFVCFVFKMMSLCVALTVLDLTPLDWAGLELRDLPASASRVLVLKAVLLRLPVR